MNGLGNLAIFGSVKRNMDAIPKGNAPTFRYFTLNQGSAVGSGDGWFIRNFDIIGGSGILFCPSFKHSLFNGTNLNLASGSQAEPYTATISYNGSAWELLLEIFSQNRSLSPTAYSWLKAKSASAPGYPPDGTPGLTLNYDSYGGAGVWYIFDGFTNRALTSTDKLFQINCTCQGRCDQQSPFGPASQEEVCRSMPRIMYATLESDDSELDGQVIPARFFSDSPRGAGYGHWLSKTPNTTRNRGMGVVISCKKTGAPSTNWDTFRVSFGSVASAGQAGIAAGGTEVDVPVGNWSYYCNNAPTFGTSGGILTGDISVGNSANDIGIASMSCVSGAFSAVTNLTTLSGSGASIRLHLSE